MFPKLSAVPLFCFFLFFAITERAQSNRVKSNVLVMYSNSGTFSGIAITEKLSSYWKNRLANKLKNDSKWPFNATIEMVDVRSNGTFATLFLQSRLQNTLLPPVSAIVGPETKGLGYSVGRIAAQYGIPVLFPILAAYPDGNLVERPSFLRTSFLIQPPAVSVLRQTIEVYVKKGVQSLITVARNTPKNSFNEDMCFGAAKIASSRGMSVQQIRVASDASQEDLQNIVNDIRNQDPDAVIWCDSVSCQVPGSEIFMPLPKFKTANYLPKAFTLTECLDKPLMKPFYNQGLFAYVNSGQYVNEKTRGVDFTEDGAPFSSEFRTPNPSPFTVTDLLNLGEISSLPSSTKLFYQTFRRLTNTTVSYQSAGVWAAFDILEAALYKASLIPAYNATGHLSGAAVMSFITTAQIPSPYGRLIFDYLGVNSGATSLMMQALPSDALAEIVAPSDTQTADFVYPMPTFDERVYTWRLLKDSNAFAAVSIAAVCTLLLLTISVTVIRHRGSVDIRMLHHLHVVSMCIAAALFVWALALVWQADVSHTQCHMLLWVVYLPPSYIVLLCNVKAFRLAAFLRASVSGDRPRPFSHYRVLRLTLLGLGSTVVLLALCVIVDPPVRSVIIPDVHRAQKNYHYCKIGPVSTGLLGVLVAVHIVMSVVCVVQVRNGMAAFRDGMVFKEAFVMLYTCLGIAFVLLQLQLTAGVAYSLRTAFLGVGLTLFVLRLLVSRVLKYWLPEVVVDAYVMFVEKIYRPVSFVINPVINPESRFSGAVNHRMSHSILAIDAPPVYLEESPQDDKLEEFFAVLRDPARLPIISELAKKAHMSENVEFLLGVLAYKSKAERLLVDQSAAISDSLKDEASAILTAFLTVGCSAEVNVSSKARALSASKLEEWKGHSPFVTPDVAKAVVTDDSLRRVTVFDLAFREIAILTYQNLWNNFLVAELEMLSVYM